jgi:hypothetical protein
MKNKYFLGIIGGLIGFIIGVFGGGYLGLIIGGTFLGGFDIYENIGIEGYEIATYVGALAGALVLTILGVIIATRISNKNKDKF